MSNDKKVGWLDKCGCAFSHNIQINKWRNECRLLVRHTYWFAYNKLSNYFYVEIKKNSEFLTIIFGPWILVFNIIGLEYVTLFWNAYKLIWNMNSFSWKRNRLFSAMKLCLLIGEIISKRTSLSLFLLERNDRIAFMWDAREIQDVWVRIFSDDRWYMYHGVKVVENNCFFFKCFTKKFFKLTIFICMYVELSLLVNNFLWYPIQIIHSYPRNRYTLYMYCIN